MMVFFVWTLFLTGAGWNFYALDRMPRCRMDFMDGILVGQVYYVIVPMAFFLCMGETGMADLSLTYRPYEDLQTTGVLIFGLFLLPALRALLPRVPSDAPDTSDPRMFALMTSIFVATALLSFSLSGLGGGGHWQGNVDQAFGNPLFLPIKYTANISRTAIFAVLFYRTMNNHMSLSSAIGYGLAFTLLDLFTTFNRITAVYFLLMALLALKNKPGRMLAVAAATLSSLSVLSGLWPVFRGLATQRGYTLESFAHALDTARQTAAKTGSSWDGFLNSVFESSNIVILNWVVENFGTQRLPHLGFAMFARPFTILLPGSLWPDRPGAIGLTFGSAIAGKPHLALNSTMYGEAYANFGWFWPLGLSVFLVGAHLVFRAMAPHARVVQMIGAFTAIAFWRFESSYIGSTAILLALLITGMWLTRTSRTRGAIDFAALRGMA